MGKMILDGSSHPHDSLPTGPYFDPENSQNITAVSGSRALLNCRVYNLGNRTVGGGWYVIIILTLLV